MKTGMELPLIGLVFVLGLVVLWNVWSGYQVDIAAAQVQATAVGGALTAPAMLGVEMVVKAALGLVLGGVVTAGIAQGVAWARRRMKTGRAWRGGPNARWQGAQVAQPEPGPRMPSEAQVYRAMLLNQYKQQGGARPDWAYKPQEDDDDEPVFRI